MTRALKSLGTEEEQLEIILSYEEEDAMLDRMAYNIQRRLSYFLGYGGSIDVDQVRDFIKEEYMDVFHNQGENYE